MSLAAPCFGGSGGPQGAALQKENKEMSGIVVSLDRSADSKNALEWAVAHATREHTPLTVLAVHQVAASPWTGAPIVYPADRPEADIEVI